VKIQEIVMFAFATRGQALEVANQTTDDTCVAAVHIGVPGLHKAVATEPVCFLVVPTPKESA
jgi:hypothetical protein